MNVKDKKKAFKMRTLRTRSKIFGTDSRPRLSVFRSNKYLYGHIINDESGKTLVAVSLKSLSADERKGAKTEISRRLGLAIANEAKNKKITTVVFDRRGYAYHGRVQAFADGAREGGLQF